MSETAALIPSARVHQLCVDCRKIYITCTECTRHKKEILNLSEHFISS